MRSKVCSTAATSAWNDVSGSGAALTAWPSAMSGRMTLLQLEPSAQAPCASTMLTSFAAIAASFRAAAGSSNLSTSTDQVIPGGVTCQVPLERLLNRGTMRHLPALFVADAPSLDFLNSVTTPSDATIDWLADG